MTLLVLARHPLCCFLVEPSIVGFFTKLPLIVRFLHVTLLLPTLLHTAPDL